MKKFKLVFLFGAMLSFILSPMVEATLYQCDNGVCVTTIIDYGSGYSWNITCSDGSSMSGNNPGGTYGGTCAQM